MNKRNARASATWSISPKICLDRNQTWHSKGHNVFYIGSRTPVLHITAEWSRQEQFSRGQLIHKESPLVLVDAGVSWPAWLSNPSSFWRAEQRGPSRVAQALAALDPQDQADYRALHAVRTNQTPLRQDLDIAEHNSYSFPYSNTRNKRAWLTILRDMSRVNHSCLPNAIMSDPCTETGNLGTVKLVATRDIAANEEILLEYESGDNFWLKPAAVRRPELFREWHFQCGCPACDSRTSPFYDSTWEYIKMLRNEVATAMPVAPDLLRARVNHLNILVGLLLAYGFADGRLSDALVPFPLGQTELMV